MRAAAVIDEKELASRVDILTNEVEEIDRILESLSKTLQVDDTNGDSEDNA